MNKLINHTISYKLIKYSAITVGLIFISSASVAANHQQGHNTSQGPLGPMAEILVTLMIISLILLAVWIKMNKD